MATSLHGFRFYRNHGAGRVTVIFPSGHQEVMGHWTTLCNPTGSVTADVATDEQIAKAVLCDESVFASSEKASDKKVRRRLLSRLRKASPDQVVTADWQLRYFPNDVFVKDDGERFFAFFGGERGLVNKQSHSTAFSRVLGRVVSIPSDSHTTLPVEIYRDV